MPLVQAETTHGCRVEVPITARTNRPPSESISSCGNDSSVRAIRLVRDWKSISSTRAANHYDAPQVVTSPYAKSDHTMDGAVPREGRRAAARGLVAAAGVGEDEQRAAG